MIEYRSVYRRSIQQTNKFFENRFQFSHLEANKSQLSRSPEGESLNFQMKIDKFS